MNVWISETLDNSLTREDEERDRSRKTISNLALSRALSGFGARAAVTSTKVFDPGVLDITTVDPFTIAFYDGKIAGVGVEIRASASGNFSLEGKVLFDWSPWFVALCLRSGKELASSC